MSRICKKCGVSIDHRPAKRMFCSKRCGDTASKNKRHGLCYSSEHVAWRDMKSRCLNPNHKDYRLYGARGITVCDRWLSFDDFIADMGLKPGKGFSIDRQNNDGNYEPSNCRWATVAQQNNNKRNVFTAEQDERLREAISRGYTFPQVAAFVGRSRGSVEAKAYRLGLRRKNAQPASQHALQVRGTAE